MSDELKNIVTVDDLMEEYLSDSVVADDELSESIFTCVDNYIDDLCIKVMNDENSVFESDTDSDTPFTYILDKVMEKVDTIEDIQTDSYCKVLENNYLEIVKKIIQLTQIIVKVLTLMKLLQKIFNYISLEILMMIHMKMVMHTELITLDFLMILTSMHKGGNKYEL